MTDFTQLSDKELNEALAFHRRQRNMSRGINESAHVRQAQIVRILEAEEARRLEEAKKPKPGHNAAVMAKNIAKVTSAIKKEEAELAEDNDDTYTQFSEEGNGTKKNRELLATGRISKDEFDRRMGYGKYKKKDPAGVGPLGKTLYKNLTKSAVKEATILPGNFADRPTPLPNKKAYAIDKANSEKKPVSLKKAPWDVKKEEVELAEAETNYVIKHKKTKQVLNTHSDYATAKDEHEGLGDEKSEYGIYKQTKKDAALRNRNTYREEVENLDEGIKEKISGVIRREKQKEYPLLQNRRDVAANKAGAAYAAGDHKKGDRYMKWRDDNMKKEEVELDEANNPNQYIEVTNKFTGAKSYHEVHPSKAFAALNHHNSLWNTKSSRIVSGKEAEGIRASKMKKEEVELAEAVQVDKKNYSWGKMITVRHGSSHSFPLHPEHQELIKNLKDGESTAFRDETGSHVTAHREGDKVHLKQRGSNEKTTVAHSHFTESVQIDELSNTTLQRYKSGANKVIDNSNDSDEIKKRSKGYALASKKLTDRVLKKEEVELDEAGAFSYGYKAPRKGSSAYNAMMMRKQQEKDQKVIEPKDQKVGNAKVTNEEVELDEASYRDSGYANMLKASRKADKEADKMRAKQEKEAKKAGEPKAEFKEEADLRITKVYNKWPKKATYAVHTPDRKYFKEFNSMEAAKAHHAEKSGK